MKPKKECSKCHALKPIDEFSFNGKTSAGKQKYRGACKLCDAKRLKKHRRGDPFLYLDLKCRQCDRVSHVRIYTSNEDGTHIFLCEGCTKKFKEKK